MLKIDKKNKSFQHIIAIERPVHCMKCSVKMPTYLDPSNILYSIRGFCDSCCNRIFIDIEKENKKFLDIERCKNCKIFNPENPENLIFDENVII